MAVPFRRFNVTDDKGSVQEIKYMGSTYKICQPYPDDPEKQPPEVEVKDGDWPGMLVCPYTGGVPLYPVHVNLLNKQKKLSPQIFEFYYVLKLLATPGSGKQTRLFKHPTHEATYRRSPRFLSFITDASPKLRSLCSKERIRRRELGQAVEHPPRITPLEIDKLKETFRLVLDTRTPMIDENDYPQQEFIVEEGQINPHDPEGAPIPFVDIAAEEAAEAAVNAAIRASLMAANDERGRQSVADESSTGPSNVTACAAARSTARSNSDSSATSGGGGGTSAISTRAQEFAARRAAVCDTVARAEEEGDELDAFVDGGPPASMRRLEMGRGNRGRGLFPGRGRRLTSSAGSARRNRNRVTMSPSTMAGQAASPATVVVGNRRPASVSALGRAHPVTLPAPRELAPGKFLAY